jgi:NAD+ diphosphatase
MDQDLTSGFYYCPKCGSAIFQTEDKGRSYHCEGCDFQYFINNSAAVACLIFNSSGELLLTRRAFEPNKGMLDLPGGFVEPMETAEEAVVREIKEELNIHVTNMTYLVSFPNLYPYSKFVVPTVDLAFICKTDQLGQLQPGDDVAAVEFIYPEKVDPGTLCSESMINILQFYLKMFPK